ncbi:MAG: hypothetical protein Q9207_006802 [Kuettlingeria erythrocarpa]
MADPLSLAAGVVGILTAAAQISSLLIDFTRSSKDAPQDARAVLTEVNDISSTLAHLQSFLLGNEYSDRSRTQLLQVDQVVTIMGGCVKTFSELEKLLDRLKAEDMGILDRAQWARNGKAISNLVQSHNIIEAKDSVDRLHGMIERCYQEMSSRVEALELRALQHTDGSSTHHQFESDTASVMNIKGPSTDALMRRLASTSSIDRPTFDFTKILQRSWVYRRNDGLNPSRLSMYSRDTCSMAWSCLSGISMAEISNISVIGLPILVEEVYNHLRYSQTWSIGALDPVCPVSPPVGLANGQAAIEFPAIEDPDDDLYADPCEIRTGIIDEGKAAKWWRNHWHRNSSQCNRCERLLDPDVSVFLVEDDGSTFCNDCVYTIAAFAVQR